MITALVLLLGGLLIAASAASVAVATAAVSREELTRWVSYRLRGAAAAHDVLENAGEVLTQANAITVLGVLAGSLALPAVLSQIPPTFVGVFTVFPAIPLFVTAAYLVPRVVGRRWAEPIVRRAVPWVQRVGRLLSPVLPSRPPTRRSALAAVIAGAETDALASADELTIVSGVLAFADRPVREIMTPRTAIVAVPEGAKAEEVRQVCAESGFSRLPVYRGSLDDIIGLVHAFDLFHHRGAEPLPVRPVLVVPGTKRCGDLLLEMQRARGHLAVVLDEFGGTAGLVTLQDVLTELVREIFDRDTATESPAPRQPLEVEGNTPLAAVESAFTVSFARRGIETVGGFLTSVLGRIPRPGERFLFGGLEFDVLHATATRVERVVVRPGPVPAVPLDPLSSSP
jgi:CBS domain containing-hemolysin-like protein